MKLPPFPVLIAFYLASCSEILLPNSKTFQVNCKGNIATENVTYGVMLSSLIMIKPKKSPFDRVPATCRRVYSIDIKWKRKVPMYG